MQYADSIIIFKMTAFKCDICDLSFQTKCGIRVHKKSKHLGITWNCNECGQKFSNNSNMNSHKRRVHKGETYHCQKCDKTYSHSATLYTHVACQGSS